ncbi:hypothetical protein [Salinibacterium sp. ZJ70]|uniref:hypothetical protein n=1 Tax=Salinibacterium sp. ZJ70 TaxID=2708084 RepID=UPI00141ECE39|nr:hypothetical protein [Salinibacterium sp. ZJ70]
MVAFSLLLRTGGFAAGVITFIAIIQAFGGRSWWVAIVWGVVAVVLSSWGRATLMSANRKEAEYLMGGLASIIDSSPQLSEAIESASQTGGRFASAPIGQKMPTAAGAIGQLVTMILVWVLTIGGPIAMVVGWFFAIDGNWGVLLAGMAAMVVGSWITSANRDGFTRSDLGDLAAAALPGTTSGPSPEIRRSLWTVAQGIVDSSIPLEHRVSMIAGVYQDLVRAWGRDQAARPA